jgi:hypothetical protein
MSRGNCGVVLGEGDSQLRDLCKLAELKSAATELIDAYNRNSAFWEVGDFTFVRRTGRNTDYRWAVVFVYELNLKSLAARVEKLTTNLTVVGFRSIMHDKEWVGGFNLWLTYRKL